MSEVEQCSMEIWGRLEKTDPKFTKRMASGAKLTSVNPEYQIKKFTEVFGPCGFGWGYSVKESLMVEGSPMMKDSIKDADGQTINFGPSITNTVRLELWYKMDDERCFIESVGHTPFVYMTNYGPITDGEYEKKSITDAITKGMSMLGMAGDVRMGLFDNSEYVYDLERTQAVDSAADREEELIRQRQEFDDWYIKTLGLAKTSNTIHELEILFKAGIIRVNGHGTKEQQKEFTEAKNMRARELMKPQLSEPANA